jgi:hypothetical protein
MDQFITLSVFVSVNNRVVYQSHSEYPISDLNALLDTMVHMEHEPVVTIDRCITHNGKHRFEITHVTTGRDGDFMRFVLTNASSMDDDIFCQLLADAITGRGWVVAEGEG